MGDDSGGEGKWERGGKGGGWEIVGFMLCVIFSVCLNNFSMNLCDIIIHISMRYNVVPG